MRASGGQEDVVRILDAMRALDRIVYHLPAPPTVPRDSDNEVDDVTNQILADEKIVSYEVYTTTLYYSYDLFLE